MPEFHPNQIQWQAPEPTTAKFEKPADLLSKPIQQLGQAAEKLADTKVRIDDAELDAQMKQAWADAINAIDTYEPEDNNYEPKKQEALSNVQRLYMNASEDARIRFARNNPLFMDELSLTADQHILKKQQDFETVRAGQMTPLFASNVVEGLSSYETEREKLREITKNLPNHIAQQYMYNFDDAIIKGNIQRMIMGTPGENPGDYMRRLKDAEKYIKDTKQSYTLSPADRNYMLKTIQDTANQLAKEREALLKGLVKGSGSGGSGDDDTKDRIKEYLTKVAFDSADKYAEALAGLTAPANKETILADGTRVVGRYIPLEGGGAISLNDLPVEDLIQVINQVDTAVQELPQIRMEIANTISRANSLHATYLQQVDSGMKAEALNTLIEMNAASQSAAFQRWVPKDMRDKYNQLWTEHLRTLNEKVQSPDLRSTTVTYNQLFSGGSRAQRIAMGLGSLASPLIGLVSPLVPLAREMEAANAAELMHQAVSNEAQFDTLATGNPAERKLHQLDRMARTATTDLRDYIEDQYGISTPYGSLGELLVNNWVYLSSSTAPELQELGLDPMVMNDMRIEESMIKILNVASQSGASGSVYSQVSGEAKDELEKVSRTYFDAVFTALQGGYNKPLTEEQTAARERLYSKLRAMTTGTGGGAFQFHPTEINVASGKPEPYAESRLKKIIKKGIKELKK